MLHSVSPDASGEVDSVRVAQDGSFEFSITDAQSLNAEAQILFASIRHEGVLYFGSAISDPAQLDSLYVIEVFRAQETPPEGILLPLSVRTVFLDPWQAGWQVTDLYQIQNPGERTLVAAEGGVVWSYPLPAGATAMQLGQGDLPPDAVAFDDGRVSVRAPLPPGERMLLVRYELPGIDAEFPAPGPTETLELLVREPAPSLEVPALRAIGVVSPDGQSSYRRYTGAALLDVVVSLRETDEADVPSMGLAAAILAALLGGAGVLAYLRPRVSTLGSTAPSASDGGAARGAPPASRPGRDGLILQVALLDESLATTSDAEKRKAIMEERTQLLARLRAQG